MKKWFEDIVISKKLSVGFATAVVLCLIAGLVGIFTLIYITKEQQDTYDTCTLGIKSSLDAELSVVELRVLVRNIYIYYDTDRDTYIDKTEKQLETVQENIDAYGKTVSSDQDQANYDAMQKAYASYKGNIDELVEAAKSNVSSSEYGSLLMSQNGSSSDVMDKFAAISEYSNTVAAQSVSDNKTFAWIMIFVMIGVIVIAVVASLLLSKFITGLIAPPVQKFSAFADRLAVGSIDLSKIIDEKDLLLKERKDEIGILAGSFNKIVSGTTKLAEETVAIAGGDLTVKVTVRSDDDIQGIALARLVEDFKELAASIISSADQVDAGAKQVANSSMSLSQGATEQASSVQELSASIMDVSQRVKANADDAEKAKELSAKSGKIMETSVEDMDLTRKAMDEISATSKNIGKVIKAIDDIAFQTNILALNAAVEAARAGAAGKGFAVVADEVRNLSQKSAEAAKSTTLLIENSISAVEKGTELVNKTNISFTELASQSSEVNRLVEQISAQAQEQSNAIMQISAGIEQVSAVIQMNSATSEESAAASEELSGQADSMKECTAKLKIR